MLNPYLRLDEYEQVFFEPVPGGVGEDVRASFKDFQSGTFLSNLEERVAELASGTIISQSWLH